MGVYPPQADARKMSGCHPSLGSWVKALIHGRMKMRTAAISAVVTATSRSARTHAGSEPPSAIECTGRSLHAHAASNRSSNEEQPCRDQAMGAPFGRLMVRA